MNEVKSGLGHQLQADQRALQASFDTLNESRNHLLKVEASLELRGEILKLMIKCNDLIYAAKEVYEQND